MIRGLSPEDDPSGHPRLSSRTPCAAGSPRPGGRHFETTIRFLTSFPFQTDHSVTSAIAGPASSDTTRLRALCGCVTGIPIQRDQPIRLPFQASWPVRPFVVERTPVWTLSSSKPREELRGHSHPHTSTGWLRFCPAVTDRTDVPHI